MDVAKVGDFGKYWSAQACPTKIAEGQVLRYRAIHNSRRNSVGGRVIGV